MLKWIRFILDLLGIWKNDIQEPEAAAAQQAQAKIQAKDQEIDHETEQEKQRVDDLSSPALDDELDRLRRQP